MTEVGVIGLNGPNVALLVDLMDPKPDKEHVPNLLLPTMEGTAMGPKDKENSASSPSAVSGCKHEITKLCINLKI